VNAELYDRIGRSYGARRQTDPRIAQQIWERSATPEPS
jgi:hypothetical protein